MPRESGIERFLVDELKSRGGDAIKLTGVLGIPDRLLLLKGVAAFAELKTPTGKLSSAQRVWSARLVRMGFSIWTPRTRDDVRHVLEWMECQISRQPTESAPKPRFGSAC